ERLDLFTGAPLKRKTQSVLKREPEMRRQWMGLASSSSVRVIRAGVASAFLCVGLVSIAVTASGQAAKPAAAAAPAKAAAGKDAGAPTTAGAKDGSAPVATSGDAGASGTSAASGAGASSTPVAGGPAVPIPDKGAMDGATYSVRLRDLEARVDELKDQIRRSHTRLALLSDTILSGGAAGSRAEVLFKNEMSSAFRLTRALFVVDGAVQYNRADDTGALADQKEIPIFSGSIPPGDHTVQVVLNFQGNGYGVFTYLRGYKFEVKSAHSFTSVEGKTLTLISTALEKGGVTTPLEQRPTIEWNEKIGALGATSGSAPVAAPPPGASPGASSGASPGASGAVKGSTSTSPGAASGSLQIGGGK
ncbi:MAG: Dihydrolipoamide acetyltransferase component of pyruvate dehydrogenase complex, partial [Myxococcaceae bacterium]|nr:Dihydrolipoamide acetyltransferase component of pyruvate dehydrogenase complex [Myxococcaceae bacterium]